jgi:dienelactone hydrolase
MKKIAIFFVLAIFSACNASAEIKSNEVEYTENGVKLKGFIAWDDAIKEKRPGILVVHEWWGINDYVRGRAKELAALGYVAFALDMYGEGESTIHPEKASEMMENLKKNEALLLSRARAGLGILRNNPNVDKSNIAVIGYCFGGYVTLKLAYAGEDIKAAVSFHGALPVPEDTSKIKSEILICHGEKDTFIPPETVKSVKDALDKGKIKYKFISYPGAMHAFTVPDAGKKGVKGLEYNENADKGSWKEMQDLFNRVFKK